MPVQSTHSIQELRPVQLGSMITNNSVPRRISSISTTPERETITSECTRMTRELVNKRIPRNIFKLQYYQNTYYPYGPYKKCYSEYSDGFFKWENENNIKAFLCQVRALTSMGRPVSALISLKTGFEGADVEVSYYKNYNANSPYFISQTFELFDKEIIRILNLIADYEKIGNEDLQLLKALHSVVSKVERVMNWFGEWPFQLCLSELAEVILQIEQAKKGKDQSDFSTFNGHLAKRQKRI